jgi:[acyl-carrier-protein] S-malonyltransferase
MQGASMRFEEVLKSYTPQEPIYPMYLNTTARPVELASLKREMVKQISSPVRFVEAILEMKKDGFTHFIEIGPGSVLSGLIRKIDGDLQVLNLDHLTDLDLVKGWLKEHGFIQ